MSSVVQDIVNDIKELNVGNLNIGSLRDKYQVGDIKKCNIQDAVGYVLNNNLQGYFVDKAFLR